MADLNALIAQGYQFQPPPDPFVQYGRMQQLEQGQQANALNRMKMDEYQRGLQEQNALRGLDPASETYLQDVTKLNPKLGFEFAKFQREAKTADTEGQIKSTKLVADKLALLPYAYRMADTPEAYLEVHKSVHADPVLGPYLKSLGATPEKGLASLEDAVRTGKFEQLRMGSMQSVSQLLDSMKPVVVGASSSVYNPNDKTFAQAPAAPIGPTDIRKLIMERDALPLNDPNRALYDRQIRDLGATAQNARDRLAFDREKLAYERANPGKTIKEITQADGSTQVFAIDNRSGMATQVMMAGALGAAPAGAGRGAVGVTGGQVGPGTPLVGAAKAGALTEAQGNAALFGSAMAQAQGVLAEVEKRGTRTGPVTTSLAQGIVKYVPLGVGDKLVGDVYALAMQDPTKLFGPDVDQQKLGQAQLAFSIAYLRKTSGAAFGPSELANTVNEFFPQIGEDASVTKQKSEARKRAIKGMKISAGKEGSKFIEEYEAPGAAGGEWKVVK
jgi:hypothetical protein